MCIFQLLSVPRVGILDGELQPSAVHSGIEIARIDVWSLAVDNEDDPPQRLSHRTLLHQIKKVGSFTPRYNMMEQLPSFTSEAGTYHAFLMACPHGARKENCREADWFMDNIALGHILSATWLLLQDYLMQHQTIGNLFLDQLVGQSA